MVYAVPTALHTEFFLLTRPLSPDRLAGIRWPVTLGAWVDVTLAIDSRSSPLGLENQSDALPERRLLSATRTVGVGRSLQVRKALKLQIRR